MKVHWALAIALSWGAVALAQAPKDAPNAPRPAARPEAAPTAAARPDAAPAGAARPAPGPVYTPPSRGAPRRRVGGASRGTEGNAPVVSVLAPDHVGLTLQAQPDLYWFISKPSPVRVELTLIDASGAAPVKEVVLASVPSAGIHRFSLREQGVRLAAGKDYEWSVAVVPDPEGRSADILSSGAIRRVAPDPALAARLAALGAGQRAQALASAGIWYDSLAELGARIDASPADRDARRARAALLEQVGLKDAAAFELR